MTDNLPYAPKVERLMLHDDVIWSPQSGDARVADTEEELRRALISVFGEEAGKRPLIFPHGDRWAAHYHRNGYDGLVYWTGANPPPLPS